MKKEDLTAQIEKAIPEGVEIDVSKLNLDGLNEFINKEENDLIAGKKKEHMTAGVDAFLTDKGYENVEAFDSASSLFNSSETEINKKLKKSNEDLDAMTKQFNTLTETRNGEQQTAILTGNDEGQFGVKKEYAKFVRSEVSALVTDKLDFKAAAKTYLEKNEHYVDHYSSGRRNIGGGGESLTEAEALMEAKYGDNAYYKKNKANKK